MKIISNEIENNRYVQIYLTKEELEKKEIKEIITKYKEKKYKIGVFVTGKENYPEIIEKIVKKQVK